MDRGAWRATGHGVAHDWVTKHTNKNKVIFWLGDENTVTEGSQEPHHVFPLGAIVSSRSNSLAFINSTLEYNNKRNNKHYGDIIKSTANNNNKLCKINLKISPFLHLTKSWGNSEFDELNSLCVCVCSWTNFFFPHVYHFHSLYIFTMYAQKQYKLILHTIIL